MHELRGIKQQSLRQSQNLSQHSLSFPLAFLDLLPFWLFLKQRQHLLAGQHVSQHSFSVMQKDDIKIRPKKYEAIAIIIT